MQNYVYWYHLNEHTDINTQGYVGITNNLKRRHYQHGTGKSGSAILANVFNKYGDSLLKSVVFVGSRQECLELECKLRPIENIGWNICIGGGSAPDCTGLIHSPETCAKRSVSVKEAKKGKHYPNKFKDVTGRYTAAQRKHIGSFHTGKIISEQHRKVLKEKFTGSNSVLSKKVHMMHKDNITKVFTYGSLGEAAKATGMSYSGLRSSYQRVTENKLCTNPSKNGWCIIHETKINEPEKTLAEVSNLRKVRMSAAPKASGKANHKSIPVTLENREGECVQFASVLQAATHIGLNETTLRYHISNANKKCEDSNFNSKGWKVKYLTCAG